MHIAILTFEGFNELDSLIALGILNRVKEPDWRVSIASPTALVRSMNGVVMEAQASLSEARAADAVIVGSGIWTREVVADAWLMAASQYLAAWVIARLKGADAARSALHYVAPVGEKDDYVSRAMRNIAPFLEASIAT
jgi:putative intracellular protease/amidase